MANFASTGHTSASRPGFVVRHFVQHPETVGETYFGHMRFALWFFSRLLVASGAAAIHALIPSLCQTTASRIVKDLYAVLTARNTPTHPG